MAVIKESGGKLLSDVKLFDIYRGDQIGAGKKSLAFNLTYQAAERTLNTEEVAKIREKIIQSLAKELKAQVRN